MGDFFFFFALGRTSSAAVGSDYEARSPYNSRRIVNHVVITVVAVK